MKILFIEGRLFSFNGVFEKQMENFKSLLSNGVKMKLDTGESITIQINTHAVITDEPGRAKTCNCKQHNGWYGCFYCLNQGVAVGRNLRCYPGINSTKRTPELYRNHVQFSLPQEAHLGIKGPSFLSELITLPEDALIDDMHCADEGVTKHLLKLWFLSRYNKCEFYLLTRINKIDSILKLVKYPKEIKRTQKSITLASYFHANEYRSLVSYPLIYILKDLCYFDKRQRGLCKHF